MAVSLWAKPGVGRKEAHSLIPASLNSIVIIHFKLVIMLNWVQNVFNDKWTFWNIAYFILSHPFSFSCVFCSTFNILGQLSCPHFNRLHIFGGICSDAFHWWGSDQKSLRPLIKFFKKFKELKKYTKRQGEIGNSREQSATGQEFYTDNMCWFSHEPRNGSLPARQSEWRPLLEPGGGWANRHKSLAPSTR